jgi:hypothetical protein
MMMMTMDYDPYPGICIYDHKLGSNNSTTILNIVQYQILYTEYRIPKIEDGSVMQACIVICYDLIVSVLIVYGAFMYMCISI